eukprot:GHVO01052429.1.p1 GENE.GHVO01052429.1~~GHVO01052429.1.p1  ORF type:complete len:578 (-),score=101.04 GHVO01052429.1:132-1865(-)
MARVVEIVSGDVIMVAPLLEVTENGKTEYVEASGMPRRLYMASIRAPRPGTRTRSDDALAPEAKEYLRKRTIGKRVNVVVEFIREPLPSNVGAPPPPGSDDEGRMHHVTIIHDGKNMNEAIVAEGLARVIRYSSEDDRSECYEALLEAETKAIKAKIGLHGADGKAVASKFDDLLGPLNAKRAAMFLDSLRNATIHDAMVDYVFNAGRYKIKLPSKDLAISFSLAGISCPQTARRDSDKEDDPLAAETLAYARDTLMQRTVSIKVDTCDKGGNFIGWLWHNKELMNAKLLAMGYGYIRLMPGTGNRPLLEESEAQARAGKRGVWSLPSAAAPIEADDVIPTGPISVEVTHVETNGDFYCQDIETMDALKRITDALADFGSNKARLESNKYNPPALPGKGHTVIAQFSADGCWYRARVDNVHRYNEEASVFYVDFGNSEVVPLNTIRRCPTHLQLSQMHPLAMSCTLAGIKIVREYSHTAFNRINESVEGGSLTATVLSIQEGRKQVVLYPRNSTKSLNEDLVVSGYAQVKKEKNQSGLYNDLNAAKDLAKSRRAGMWQHGDLEENSEDERMFPKLVK